MWSLGCVLFELYTALQPLRPFFNDFVVGEFKSLELMSIPIKDGLSLKFQEVVKWEWIHKMLQREHQHRPTAKSVVRDFSSLLSAACDLPEKKLIPFSFICKNTMLGTDGPLRDGIIRWEDIFVPGTFRQSKAMYERYQRIYDTRNKILGTEHPASRWSALRLAWATFYFKDQYSSERILKRVLKKELEYEDVHQRTLPIRTALAQCLHWQGKDTTAREQFEEILQSVNLAANDPTRLFCEAELTWLLYELDLRQDTGQKLENILSRRKGVFDSDHPDISLSKCGLGWFFRSEQQYQTALIYFQEALEARKRVLGMGHPKTVDSMIALAWRHKDLGLPNVQLFEEAVEAAERVLGPYHKETPAAVKMLRHLRAAGKQ